MQRATTRVAHCSLIGWLTVPGSDGLKRGGATQKEWLKCRSDGLERCGLVVDLTGPRQRGGAGDQEPTLERCCSSVPPYRLSRYSRRE